MTEEERQNEKHLAIDNYEKAYKERATCEARVSRIFQDLEQIMDLHRQGSLVSNQGNNILACTGRIGYLSGFSSVTEKTTSLGNCATVLPSRSR